MDEFRSRSGTSVSRMLQCARLFWSVDDAFCMLVQSHGLISGSGSCARRIGFLINYFPLKLGVVGSSLSCLLVRDMDAGSMSSSCPY
jgi:hypothetical protein